ncbi:MAG TPA: hypothetical protein VJR92_01010 [Gemmatimonadaceae bacterium]|nr:hypothetical protein [Gemmatimonadaceae bacterium]
MISRVFASLLFVAPFAIARAQGPANEPPALSSGAVAGQISTGTLGTLVGFIGGGVTTRWVVRKLGVNEENAGRVAAVGAFVGVSAVTPIGPALIGSRGDAKGSYGSAVGGAAAGALVGLGVKELGKRGAFGGSGPVAWVAGIVIATLPSVGATIAYNGTR